MPRLECGDITRGHRRMAMVAMQIYDRQISRKNIVIAVTFLLSFCLFVAMTVIDYYQRLGDLRFYSRSTMDIIARSFKSEQDYLVRRNLNYMKSVVDDQGIIKLIRDKDTKGLSEIYSPLYKNFKQRMVPVILFTIVDPSGHVLYRASDYTLEGSKQQTISKTLLHVLERKKEVHGFESDFVPFIYDIGIPIIDSRTGALAGAIEIGVAPEFFQFKSSMLFEGVKSAMVTRDAPQGEYRFVDKTISPQEDLQLFSKVMPLLGNKRDFSEIKTGGTYYLICTALRFQDHDGHEAGRYLVAYNMNHFKKNQWKYLYNRLLLFLPMVSVLMFVIYQGFRKYEVIITEKNQQLAQKSKHAALGEMLGHIGHQWRQPLHTLSLAVQNIELQGALGTLDEALLKKQVALANQNIRYMSNIIDDWRALLMSGSSRQEIYLNESVERAISMVAPIMESHRIAIENRITAPIPTMGFVNDLVQLTINVLLNAKDQLCMTEGQRVVLLSVREEPGNLVTVMFQDSAGGIPAHLLRRIFEPYVTTKDKADGTGLGLYLCKQIAENLDEGRVWAENLSFEVNGTVHYGACICLQFAKSTPKESP